ncbi:MAG: hypothetical protein IJ788_03280, partial [Oscillospiraceae bacterium]|nr:hypothetical protein [Oscillospiraceae bacterium]
LQSCVKQNRRLWPAAKRLAKICGATEPRLCELSFNYFTVYLTGCSSNGTDGLEVFEWTTDWSDYFDEGHEWWGALCFTVYDKTLDRFAVIMASATD